MISKKLKDRQFEAIAKLRTALYMRLNERSGWSDSDIQDFMIMFDETVREVIENDGSIVEKGIERPISEVKEPVTCKNIPIHKNAEGIEDCGFCNQEIVKPLKSLYTFRQNDIWFFKCPECGKPNLLPQHIVDKQVIPIDNHNGHESEEAVPGSSFSNIERITRLEKAFLESRRTYDNDIRTYKTECTKHIEEGFTRIRKSLDSTISQLNDKVISFKKPRRICRKRYKYRKSYQRIGINIESRISAIEKDLAFLKVSATTKATA